MKTVDALIHAAVRGKLTRTDALELRKDNPEVITLAFLAAAQHIARLDAWTNGQPLSPSIDSRLRAPTAVDPMDRVFGHRRLDLIGNVVVVPDAIPKVRRRRA